MLLAGGLSNLVVEPNVVKLNNEIRQETCKANSGDLTEHGNQRLLCEVVGACSERKHNLCHHEGAADRRASKQRTLSRLLLAVLFSKNIGAKERGGQKDVAKRHFHSESVNQLHNLYVHENGADDNPAKKAGFTE